MNEEKTEYGGYFIIKEGDNFYVVMPDLFTGMMHQRSFEEAKRFIDYVNNRRHEWVC